MKTVDGRTIPCGVLIDGWPWGHGADKVGLSAADKAASGGTKFRCCKCGKISADGPHWYPAGTVSDMSPGSAPVEWICSPCARTWSRATFVACDLLTDGPWAWYWRERYEAKSTREEDPARQDGPTEATVPEDGG